MSGDLRSAVTGLGHIDLPTLLDAATLQTRVDRKYLLPTATAADLVHAQGPRLVALEIDGSRESRYESVYFDTPGLTSYHATAHGRRRWFKVRTRTYLDSRSSMLELKRVSARGETVKDRIDYPVAARRHVDPFARGFLTGLGVPGDLVDSLGVTLLTEYRRTTLLSHDGSRITLDVGLTCRAPDGTTCTVRDLAIVETKSAGSPTPVDRLLWSWGQRPQPMSKYGTGLAATRPGLPANKWNRTLRRHFGWSPATA